MRKGASPIEVGQLNSPTNNETDNNCSQIHISRNQLINETVFSLDHSHYTNTFNLLDLQPARAPPAQTLSIQTHKLKKKTTAAFDLKKIIRK